MLRRILSVTSRCCRRPTAVLAIVARRCRSATLTIPRAIRSPGPTGIRRLRHRFRPPATDITTWAYSTPSVGRRRRPSPRPAQPRRRNESLHRTALTVTSSARQSATGRCKGGATGSAWPTSRKGRPVNSRLWCDVIRAGSMHQWTGD